MSDAPPSLWATSMAIRKQRLDLYARALEIQKEFYMLFGRFPTVDEVAKQLESPDCDKP